MLYTYLIPLSHESAMVVVAAFVSVMVFDSQRGKVLPPRADTV